TRIGPILSDFAQEGGPTTFFDEQRVKIAGIVAVSRTKTTKTNKLMAYVTLEDDTGSMELLVFARVLEQSGNYLTVGTPVLAEGRLSVRDEKPPQLLVDTISPLAQETGPDLPPEAGEAARPGVVPDARRIWLRLPSQDTPEAKKAHQMLVMFPGTGRMIFYYADTGVRERQPCLIHTSLVRELKALLGEENVVVN
ncbi:MAG: OB-fold nucleic acid binding domain-containing protein, partial [Clostridiales bacterium]|nr:OB-fold nucleic acid binding domain-containing protein [Clostridiales bacterium]